MLTYFSLQIQILKKYFSIKASQAKKIIQIAIKYIAFFLNEFTPYSNYIVLLNIFFSRDT